MIFGAPVTLRRPLDTSIRPACSETPYTPMTAIPEPSSKVRKRKSGVAFADRPTTISAEQIDEFRRRLARGYYNAPAVQSEVARRILQSGDLR